MATPLGVFAAARHRPRAWLAAAVASATVLSGLAFVGGPAAATPMAAIGHAAPLPKGATRLGALPGGEMLHLSVVLASPDRAALDAAAAAVSTPSSPSFRSFLSPAQVSVAFGPSEGTVAAVTSWLRSEGLAVGAPSGDGLVIPVQGTAERLSSTFGTPLVQVRLPGGRMAFANATAPEVPSPLSASITAVVGLSSIVQLTDGAVVGPSGTARASSIKRTTSVTGLTSCAGANALGDAYSTQQIDTAYDFAPIYAAGDQGQGITVALFELANFNTADVTTFDHCYGITPNVTRVAIDGGISLASSGGGAVESTSDVETVASAAPKAKIIAYLAPNQVSSLIDEYAQIAQNDVAQVVSSSWGECEADLDLGAGENLADIESVLFEEMALEGQSMLAATGDSGSAACTEDIGSGGINGGDAANAYAPAVGDPASQPFVTAVGGTQITTLANPPVEKVWNETGASAGGSGFAAPFDGTDGHSNRYPGNAATTGGISALWRMPTWQAPVASPELSSPIPCGAPADEYCREVPDVSALAASGNSTPGYSIYGTSAGFGGVGWTAVGGTSLASPLWAGLIALSDEQIPSKRLGLVSPSLYLLSASAFDDVKVGNDDYTSNAVGPDSDDLCTYASVSDQPCYEATSGYDLATGRGSPVGLVLMHDLVALRVTLTTTSLPAGKMAKAYSAKVVASKGEAPYTWAITSGALPKGLSLAETTGVISGTPTVRGTFAFSIRVSDDAGPPPTTATRTYVIVIS
jgi:subtilase family serine protease